MSSLYIRKANEKDIRHVCTHLREEDAREISTISGNKKPGRMAFIGAMQSNLVFCAGEDRQRPFVIFGTAISRNPERNDGLRMGSVWLLATHEASKHSLWIAKRARKWIPRLFELGDFSELNNLADLRNVLHIGWIEAMGFTLHGLHVINGHDFQHFSMKREAALCATPSQRLLPSAQESKQAAY